MRSTAAEPGIREKRLAETENDALSRPLFSHALLRPAGHAPLHVLANSLPTQNEYFKRIREEL